MLSPKPGLTNVQNWGPQSRAPVLLQSGSLTRHLKHGLSSPRPQRDKEEAPHSIRMPAHSRKQTHKKLNSGRGSDIDVNPSRALEKGTVRGNCAPLLPSCGTSGEGAVSVSNPSTVKGVTTAFLWRLWGRGKMTTVKAGKRTPNTSHYSICGGQH